MSREQMQWHPAVHERLANEQLVFWRLGFYPTYRRKEVLQALDIICERYGISGRTIYEVFGNYDLLLRLWLPEGVVAENVDRDIKRTLAAFHLELCAAFEVEKIVRHWFWDEEDERDEGGSESMPPNGGLGEALDFDSFPNEGVELPELEPTPPAWELAHVNELVDQFNSGQIDQETVKRDEMAQKFLNRKLIGLRDAEEGIKFTMVVSAYGLTASRFEAMEELERRLALILDGAKPIRERSLYSGGGFGRFMVFGKIPTEDFYEINERLIEPITVQAGLAPVYRTRSETYIGSNPILQRFSETLSLPEYEAEEIDIAEVLAEGETARNEFKSTAFTNVNRWLKTGERVDDGYAIKSFATALVALLNGTGGVIVSGVLERSVRDYDSTPKLADEPRVGDLIVIGMEFEWEDWQREGVDEFKNKLRQKLGELIEPNPLNYELQMHSYVVSGRTVFLIHVPEGLPTWFYRREGKDYRFIVRRDASSVEISGPEEDEYKRLHPRAP